MTDTTAQTIAFRTRQEIFDTAYLGLAGQGFQRSLMAEGTNDCAYLSHDGLKCAVGFLIDASAYSSDLEGRPASNPTVCSAARINAELDGKFVRTLQACHDGATTPERMKTFLLDFALKHKLTVPQIPAEGVSA